MRRAFLALVACGLLGAAPAPPPPPLTVEGYLELTLDLLDSGIDGSRRLASVLRLGHREGEEPVDRLKAAMVDEEARILAEAGITREAFAAFGTERQEEINIYLMEHPAEQQRLLELALELRAVVGELMRLGAGPAPPEAGPAPPAAGEKEEGG